MGMFLIFHHAKIIGYFTEIKMYQNSRLNTIVKGISISSQTILRKMRQKYTARAAVK